MRKGGWSEANLPNGRYRVQVWHPLLNESTSTLERVVAGQRRRERSSR